MKDERGEREGERQEEDEEEEEEVREKCHVIRFGREGSGSELDLPNRITSIFQICLGLSQPYNVTGWGVGEVGRGGGGRGVGRIDFWLPL